MADIVTYEQWNNDKFHELAQQDEYKGARAVLDWAYQTYDRIVYACSFGAEGIVLLDLISAIQPDARVIFLDTGFHFQQTYELIDQVKERYRKLRIEMHRPDLTPQEQADVYGEALWERDPDRCCHIRKIVPLEKVLSDQQAWISGLRREQSPTRRNVEFIHEDQKFGLTKICPLIYWTWKDVWKYILDRQLPYHPLHDAGYPSIGCEQCTAPVQPGEDLRAGRWANMEKTECGLHLSK